MAGVTPLPVPADPRGPVSRSIDLVRRTWERRSWYFGAAVAACCIAAPFMSAGYVALLFSPKHVGNTPGQVLADVVNATVLMLVLSVADTAVEEGARMRRTYAIALVVGALVASLVQWEMLELLDIRTYMRRVVMPLPYRLTQIAFVAASNLMVGGLLLWVHVQWREGRRSAQALHRGESLLDA